MPWILGHTKPGKCGDVNKLGVALRMASSKKKNSDFSVGRSQGIIDNTIVDEVKARRAADDNGSEAAASPVRVDVNPDASDENREPDIKTDQDDQVLGSILQDIGADIGARADQPPER